MISSIEKKPLTLVYKKLFPDAYPPRKDTPNSWVLYAYLMSESGRSIQAVLPPKTVRTIYTGLELRPPKGYSIIQHQWLGFVYSTPPIQNIINFETFQSNFQINLYNAGHESHYLRHGDPISLISLQPKLENFDVVEQEEPNEHIS